MKIRNWIFIAALLSFTSALAQEKVFSVNSGEYGLLQIPISFNLDNLNYSANNDSVCINVYRQSKRELIKLKCQIEQGDLNRVWFVPDQPIPPNEKVNFIVKIEDCSVSPGATNTGLEMNDENIHVQALGKGVLDYRHAYQKAPQGVNPIYGKSGYIHPLYSPKGNVLTRIQPPDHFHHYGIWNPWTKTKVNGKEVDFWNLALGQGTVKYAGLLSTSAGEVFSGFKIKQEHITYQNLGPDKVAINETWEIRSAPVEIDGQLCWMVDMIISLNNNLDSLIELTNYRYGGGIGFRATEHWTNQNSSVLTSEGKTRIDADGTHARWCKVEGAFPTGSNSGVVFFSHPDNRAHPEPMRVWPIDANGDRGDVFFEFCPIRHQKWILHPNREYVLKYRMLIFDDEFSAPNAESIWQSFANEPSINWKK